MASNTQVHYFLLHAEVDRDFPHGDSDLLSSSGAFVSCWIDFPEISGARALACHYLTSYGWIPGEFEEEKEVSQKNFEGREEEKYFLEAKNQGSSFVFSLYRD